MSKIAVVTPNLQPTCIVFMIFYFIVKHGVFKYQIIWQCVPEHYQEKSSQCDSHMHHMLGHGNFDMINKLRHYQDVSSMFALSYSA